MNERHFKSPVKINSVPSHVWENIWSNSCPEAWFNNEIEPKSNFSTDHCKPVPFLITTGPHGKSKMNHRNDESPFTFIIEHVHQIGIVIVNVQIHQELNEHNIEQQSSDSLQVMLIQPTNGTSTEIGAVIIIRLKSAYSWEIFTLLTGYFLVLFFELVKFSRRILLKLGEEIRVDVDKFTVFDSVDRRRWKVDDLVGVNLD